MTQPGAPMFVAAVNGILHRYFIWIVLGSYLIAAVRPGFGLWIRSADLAEMVAAPVIYPLRLPQLMLAALLINAGLGVRIRTLWALLRKPRLLIAGVLANVLVPLTYIFALSMLLKGWSDPEESQQLLVGIALVAAMPIAGASTAWSQNANGHVALSLGLVLASTLLSPLLTPVVLHAVGLVTTGDYSEDLDELARDEVTTFLGGWVILPSVSGILIRHAIGDKRFDVVQPYLKLCNYAVLILLNYSNAALTLPGALAEQDLDFLFLVALIVLGLCVLGFACGHRLARGLSAERSETIALMFGLGMNNNGTGLVLAAMALTDHPQVMLPIIFYNIAQQIVAATVDRVMNRASQA